MQENYLAKWLNNELTEAELAAFKKTDEYASYQRIIEASDRMQQPDFNDDDALKAIKNKRLLKQTNIVHLQPYKAFLKVAAVAAVLLVSAYFYLGTLNETFSTQLAEQTTVVLPDSSEVILNADSQISFSEKNWQEERSVQLQGEAFFKVAKGETFTVVTSSGNITVLGTEFNVEQREDFFEVSCFEGVVGISYNGVEKEVSAGNSFFAIKGKISEDKTILNGAPSWVNAESTFKSTPLRFVLEEFKRQHNVTLTTTNVDTDQLFSGTFSHTDIELALKSICLPSRIKYSKEGNKVQLYAENEK